jgi:hypothetical protein
VQVGFPLASLRREPYINFKRRHLLLRGLAFYRKRFHREAPSRGKSPLTLNYPRELIFIRGLSLATHDYLSLGKSGIFVIEDCRRFN